MTSISKTSDWSPRAVLFATVLAAAVGGLSYAAAAQDSNMANNLYAAAYAEEQCGEADFTQAQWQVIVAKVGKSQQSAGNMLAMMEDSEDKVSAIRHKLGCKAEALQELRGLFAREIAPAL